MNATVKKILIAVIILAALGFIFYPRFFSNNENEAPATENQSDKTNKKLPVSALVLQKGALNNTLRSTGSLLANESIELKAEVSGIVESIHFKEGQKVKKGQLLLTINDDEILAEIEKLKFTRKLNEDITDRQQKLLAKEAISKEEYETAMTTLNTTMADIKVREAQLNKHHIRAPFSGIIGLREISVGSSLNPGDRISNLYSIDPIKIDFSVPGKYISEVSAGDKISFSTDSYEETFNGEIYAIEPRIDPKTRSLRIRALCSNDENKLLPGQFAKINLTLSTYESALMIPTEAVIPELNGKKVFIYKNGVAEARNVQTGIRTADKVQVTEGLSAGDTVLTSGALQLKQGLPVNIQINSQP
ncbi:efflux RND transporter periplasmic adaptor subunit [Fulvivirga sediminis]|uniref:Efflux RND transporter periplasmic adaptor subunit n=1 Tax=Fulvivirga sediminis TaxID=2803949 RepID=A0A937FAR2_9BACT|nr:efflux RND transporter periplasmic adaptor subunit [Fulvivirga sediminis]MBL3657394.1 efflux RND transporter periplasmic adaptor subunit [Fulvivirga sediminis]